MTSKEIRQSFLDFFKEKAHTIVPSSSLMPSSPNLLFTNAGMNQFVPYFLGTQKAPYDPPRAAYTQKCIRAGGKHNDLEDVGYDTYHHTFFEMLGNWSFGNYFKAEAIAWAWELLVDRWKLPPERLYATVYMPGDGDPSAFDQEAFNIWAGLFKKAGLDPATHIVNGGVKDNFWMMGETGPCGPCSEVHMDLTPDGDSKGKLVNADDPRCIEIWNLVFIQFNAEADGSYRPLPACHVDTGMGFERVASIIQGSKGLTDFSHPISNYNTDIFKPIFDTLSEISGRSYAGTVPRPGLREGGSEEELTDIAFRVIADHVRTLSCAIADGILPDKNDRNYVLRRILRRAVRFGRTLGLGQSGQPFLSKLVPTVADELGGVFPELRANQKRIEEVLDAEEESFTRTLDRGLALFDKALADVQWKKNDAFPPDVAFDLYHTFGFPLDLTELMARENGLGLDQARVGELMEIERERSRGAGKKEHIAALDATSEVETEFTGFDRDEDAVRIVDTLEKDGDAFVIVDKSPLYAEMGGQMSDTGELETGGEKIRVLDTSMVGAAYCLKVEHLPAAWEDGTPLEATLRVDAPRRRSIEAHHTATHLLHWALHEVVGEEVAQQGSLVAPDRLRFDFNSKALTPEQVREIEVVVNSRIAENAPVSWKETAYDSVRERGDVMQFFGDKYGDTVRVVQIGGHTAGLDGYSMELCGGTHVRATGQIGMFKIRSEGAIAAGTRRIEAVCANAAIAHVHQTLDAQAATIQELEGKLLETRKTLEKERNAALAQQSDGMVKDMIARAQDAGGTRLVVEKLAQGGPALVQEVLNGFKKQQFEGIAILGAEEGGKIHLGICVPKSLSKQHPAGKLMQQLAPIVGGRGGGKPEMARGAGDQPGEWENLAGKAREVVGG